MFSMIIIIIIIIIINFDDDDDDDNLRRSFLATILPIFQLSVLLYWI